MRLLWSCVLVAGLFLVGLEVYEGQRSAGTTPNGSVGEVTALEDGTPMPTPPPPPPSSR